MTVVLPLGVPFARHTGIVEHLDPGRSGSAVVVDGRRWQPLCVDYVRIWADENGESHLEDVSTERAVQPAGAGTTELRFTPGVRVDRLQFIDADADEQLPDWHRAPRRQFVVFLDGWARITASDGDTRELARGGVLLAEDLHGQGHITELEPGLRRILQIPMDPSPDPSASIR
jgi:hypothetical protein